MYRLSLLLMLPLWLAGALTTAPVAATQLTYEVDPAASHIQWLVFRAGPAAKLGHDHVISAPEFSGTVTVNTADLSASRFELEIPVGSLVVDDPTLREALGKDFSAVPTAADVAGTRKHMLGRRVLDATHYPMLKLSGSGPVGKPGEQMLHVKIELVGHSVALDLPTTVVVNDGSIEAQGEFSLNHADLGLKPFRALLGALQVAEQISFSYRIRAMRVLAP